MKSYACLFLSAFFCLIVNAQTGKVSITGKLSKNDKASVIYIRNIDGVIIPVTIKDENSFSIVTNKLQQGFYEMDKVGTVYLAHSYNLIIKPGKDNSYVFAGTGSLENNALQNAKKQIPALLHLNETGELDSVAYFTDVPVFLQKIDSFQHSGEALFNKSTDTFFIKYASLDLQFNSKHLIYLYNAFYGIDHDKMMHMPDYVRKLDQKAPDFVTKITALMKSVHVKEMAMDERKKLGDLIYVNWDKNDETLFRNSSYYRESFQNFFASMSYNPKYFSLPKAEDLSAKMKEMKLEDADIKKLAVAKGEISNPYILSYFNYTITNTILLKSRDTSVINKYYNQFVSSNPRQDYLANIKESYQNLVIFKDNKPAPPFSYKDVLGKQVSLESLKGKYVYIDVWATWCEPCKREIPYLKKVEDAYQAKNIQFVSISVDEQGSVGQWKNFVKKNNLQGIQLITDNAFETSFIKKMSINSIPRFILIDPAGKIVSADAFRPSNEELKKTFDKLLLN